AWSEARSEADRDALTGLYTRRVFDEMLAELTSPPRSGPVSLLMIDLDHFKRVNDTHGHQVGDEVLREVAETILTAVREESDVAARYGGEEMTVIAPGTDRVGASELAERIRARVAEARVLAGGTVVSVTVSVGVAALDPTDDGEDPARSLVEEADRRLYEAKGAGRNMVAA
ncbi:MAG: diguanylate cyclase, partial [Armatimonadota bacterium]